MSQLSTREKTATYNILGYKNSYKNSKDLLDDELKDLNFEDYYFVELIVRYKWFWQSLPFMSNIAVCNSHSLGMSDEGSDIDLFVVTHKKYVYLVRLLMVLGLQVLGMRRHGTLVKSRFCLSFFVEEGFDLKEISLENDYYMSLWRENLWWLFDSDFDDIYSVCGNSKFKMKQNLLGLKKNKIALLGEFLLDNKLGVGFVWVCGVVQRLIAHKKYKQKKFPKGVVFEENIIKCHDQDIRWEVRNKVEALFRIS